MAATDLPVGVCIFAKVTADKVLRDLLWSDAFPSGVGCPHAIALPVCRLVPVAWIWDESVKKDKDVYFDRQTDTQTHRQMKRK